MLPKLLLSRLETILDSQFDSVMHAFDMERRGVFRINTLKGDGSDVFVELEKKGIVVTPFAPSSPPNKGESEDVSQKGIHNSVTPPNLPFSGEGFGGIYFFDKKDDFALKGTDAFYQGRIYLQSLASMLPVLALMPKSGESILDVCAAPGSKTTQMAALMNNYGSITALEQNQIRYDKLMYNAKLQGATIIEGKKMDARNFLSYHCEEERRSNPETKNESILGLDRHASLAMTEHQYFDRILLDAPCSAEGRIQLKNEKTYGFWTLENIKKKAELQYELLSLAVSRLKTGGTLVYSTCTLAPEENEGVISKVLSEHPEIQMENIDIGLGERDWWTPGIISFGQAKFTEEMKKAVRILPSEETEGFFLAKIIKK